MATSSRVPFLNLSFDNVRLDDVFEIVSSKIASRSYGYMASVNLDMLVKADKDPAFKEFLQGADLLLMDSTPLMRLSNVIGVPVKQKLAGSDLMPQICGFAEENGLSVFILGGKPGVPEEAALRLKERYRNLQVAGTLSPDYGFERDVDSIVEIANVIGESHADILFVCFGAPKSEMLCSLLFDLTGVSFAFCIGAAVDFAAGAVKRAPKWMQDAGLEWLYRFSKEPKRLFKRYFVDSWHMASIVYRSARENRSAMGLRAYALKAENTYYWWMDKLAKQRYIREYPKYLRKLGVHISEQPGDCWISPTIFLDSSGYDMIEIGNDCTISFDVVILVHDYSINNAFKAIGEPEAEKHRMIKRPVKIGNNCFIGARTIIMPGAVIGDNCIVGSGAVVRGKVPAGSIVSGNPATVIADVKEFARRHAQRGDWVLDER